MRLAALGLAAALATSACGKAEDGEYGPDVLALKGQVAAGQAAAAVPVLQEMAGKGRADAAAVLAETYVAGAGGAPKDLKAACALSDRAGPEFAPAIYARAACLEQGAAKADERQIAKLYRQASRMGHPRSQWAMCRLLLQGKGVKPNPPRAAALCEQAANAGIVEAMSQLGAMHLLAMQVERNPVKAREWFQKAAERGDADAAFRLGQIHWNGDGTPEDNALAARWWLTAYERGRLDAAKLLADEAFVRADPGGEAFDPAAADEAIAWYEKALAAGLIPEMEADARKSIETLKQAKAPAR